jgi:hypothetical protein
MTADAYTDLSEDDDAPSAAVIEKQAQEQVGFSDEDEISENDRSTVAVSHRPTVSSEGETAAKTTSKILSAEESASLNVTLKNAAYAAEKEAFMNGEPGGMPIGEYIARIGCDAVPPGRSSLWFRGDGPDSGLWLFVIAPKQKGAVQPGYRVTLAYGREKAGEIQMEACALLQAQDKNGEKLKFDKCCLVRHDGAKFIPGGVINEQELVGRVSDIEFGINPFSFDER